MNKKVLAAASLAAMVAAPAVAQDGAFYFKGGLGYGMPTEADVVRPTGDGEIDFKGDLRYMLGAGYDFSNNWRIDLDVVRRSNDGGQVDDGSPTSTEIRSTAVMLNAIYDLDRFSRFTPYLGAGVGLPMLDGELVGAAYGPHPAISEKVDGHEVGGDLAWQGLAGVSFDLNDRLTADLEYRYIDLGDLEGTGFDFEDVESHDILFGLRLALGQPAPAPAPAPAPPPAAPAQQPAAVAACEDVEFIVYFGWDESSLTSQATQTIATAAQRAQTCDITRVSIEGHTDSSGDAGYNVRLSERRARVVRDELVRRGVPASVIAIEARGESDPAVATGDNVREPQNRRSEVVIVVQ
ncbi:MAG: outer membrane beta-barrel protein [Maricaulaceae bacterium]|jgi:outer membrane protein OmpA-like peptidoglycan-associated protein/outer membrane protein W